ncbi:MAG: ORF6N domain-containing protein [Candidatus Margulisiibacteriota bacterium]
MMAIEGIESKIYEIRGQKVMLDYDLANLYGVETKYLKRQVKRNTSRFPGDFMFQLVKEENLKCQNVTSSYGGRRYLSYAFTEQGIAMLSSILNSERAVQVNIQIMRAFVRFRQTLALHKELADKFKELESRVDGHDTAILQVVAEIKRIVAIEEKPKRRIGFVQERGE